MMARPFHSTFLMFLILLIIQINISTLAQPNNNAVVTDELIHRICSKTNNPSLCLNTLQSSKYKRLHVPNSVAAIGSNSMNMALYHANSTAKLIWRFYSGTPVKNHETRLRYHKCYMKYAVDVKDQLTKANEYMMSSSGDAKSVKNCVSFAVKRIDSCSQELMKPPREQSAGIILEANRKVQDLCSIILAICNQVPK